MLKEAIEKIVELAGPKVFGVGDDTFIQLGEEYEQVHRYVPMPAELELTSLDALVKMVETEALANETLVPPVYITVKDHLTVQAFVSEVQPGHRPFLYSAVAADVPGWNAEVRLPFDQAAVALQTRFQDGGDREYTLQLLSNITTGAKVTYNDIGVATNVIVAKGVALQAQEKIRPLVRLRPYRTFQEVEQPEGLFLIRVDERGITFTEADGGMWKLHARQTVAQWLTERLRAEVDEGRVVIAL